MLGLQLGVTFDDLAQVSRQRAIVRIAGYQELCKGAQIGDLFSREFGDVLDQLLRIALVLDSLGKLATLEYVEHGRNERRVSVFGDPVIKHLVLRNDNA